MLESVDITVAIIGGLCVAVPTVITSILTYVSQRNDRAIGAAENKKVMEMRFDAIDKQFDGINKKLDEHNEKLDKHNGFEGRIIAIEKYVEFHERDIERLEKVHG